MQKPYFRLKNHVCTFFTGYIVKIPHAKISANRVEAKLKVLQGQMLLFLRMLKQNFLKKFIFCTVAIS